MSGGDRTRRVALRIWRVFGFLGYFLGRLVAANLVVAREIVTPGLSLRPGIVAYRAGAVTEAELVLLSMVIGLTPGTLAVAIERDPPVLFVHGMYTGDVPAFRRQLAEMEGRLLLAMRAVDRRPGPGAPSGAGARPGTGGDR